MSKPTGDVWLKFDQADDEEPTMEANTFKNEDGYEIQWYHVDVGLVHSVHSPSLNEVHAWYAQNGFTDFTA